MKYLTAYTIKYTILTIFCLAVLTPAAVVHAADLSVSFEQTPLFYNANIVPGNGESRVVTITNNGVDTENVYTTVDNVVSDGLSDDIEISISSSGDTYLATTTFSDFFNNIPLGLGTLASGESRVYTYAAFFATSSVSGNSYMAFDLIVGFEDGEAVSDGGGGGVSGGIGGSVDDIDSSSVLPEGIIAGASTSNTSDPFSFLGSIGDFVGGLIAGESTTTAQTLESSDTEKNASDVYFHLSGLCLLSWIVAFMLTAIMVIDYIQNRKNENYFGILRRFSIYSLIGLFMAVSSLLYSFPCEWWPFASLSLVSFFVLIKLYKDFR